MKRNLIQSNLIKCINSTSWFFQNNNKPKVSLDFDSTLTNKNIFFEIHNLIQERKDIDWWILTSRFGVNGLHPTLDKINGWSNEDIALISMWLNLYDEDLERHKVVFTMGNSKTHLLNKMGVRLHLDDDEWETHSSVVTDIVIFKERLKDIKRD